MRIVSDNIKNAQKKPTTQRKGKILVNENYYEVYNVEYYADAYNEGNVIGNAIASQLDFDLPYMEKFDSFKYFDGVWTGNEYEYVDMGTFKVFDEKDQDEFNKHITAFDLLINFNKPFINKGDYPKTLYDELVNVCEQAEVELENTSIPNGDFIIENNQFVGGENIKAVLKSICGASGNFAIIKNDKLKLLLKNETDMIFNKSEHEPVDWKRRTYGINQVVLGMSDVQGEYVTKQDDEDIAINGVHKLVINDNYFAYTQNKRLELIDGLFEQVKGFGYIPYEMNMEWQNYLELGDTINLDGIDTIVLRIDGKSPNSVESNMSAPAIIDSAVEYTKNTETIKNQQRRTEFWVDKNTGDIVGLTKQTTEIRDNLNNNYYTIEQANTLIQNAETGVTNTFSEAGGNNIFRNTGLWFENSGEDSEENPYEFWTGKANTGNNDKATGYRSILLQNGSFIQNDVKVPNGNYSISFYYRKLISNAIASVVINDKEYSLDSLETKQFYTGEQDNETGEYIVDPIQVTNNNIKIEFKCDAVDGVEIYDLMCNKGSVKLAYSQNQNETTTSTVNISRGITITSSTEENTKFKADYDGIRILDKNNNPKTKFTDKGTETDELVVRKKATITGLLQQEVDDQTWVTKI